MASKDSANKKDDEQLDDENLDQPDDDEQVGDGEEYTAEEQQAMAEGWNPDYDGPNPRSAHEYLDRSSFFKKIEAQNQIINNLNKDVKFLVERNKTAQKVAYDQALKDLKAQKRQALEADDHDAVIEIDEQIMATRDAAKAEEQDATDNENDNTNDSTPDPQFESWSENNQWYHANPEMHDVADAIGRRYVTNNPKASVMQVLKYVEGEIRNMYSDQFSNEKRGRKQAVENGTNNRNNRSTSKRTKHTAADLNDDDRRIMRTMIQQGNVKDEATYIEKLEKNGFFN